MLKKKIVFLGSKPIGYECFAHMLAKREELNIEIVGLLTHARKEFGNAHDLSTLAEEHKITIIEDENDIPACDILYSVQYHKILKQEQINKASEIAVNLHMAPLPEYRGSNQFSYAIIDDKKEFGTTIHQIDTQIDHGAILFQKRFPIPDNCWVSELYELTYNASLNLFKESLASIINCAYNPIPQQSLETQYGTSLHYRKDIMALKQISLDWDSQKIQKHIRATYMPGFEPPYCILNGKKIYFSASYS